jgi:hypothetical protein
MKFQRKVLISNFLYGYQFSKIGFRAAKLESTESMFYEHFKIGMLYAGWRRTISNSRVKLG